MMRQDIKIEMSESAEFSTNDAVRMYLPMMHEIATRIGLVAHAAEGRLNMTPPYAYEYAYLQFRRICELIALGCLQLHGDLPGAQTKSAHKEWHAEKIMNLLHREHPTAFPQSVIWEQTPQGVKIQCNSKKNALTIDEFKKLYHECGGVLHRGTIKTLENSLLAYFRSSDDYNKVPYWQQKIVDLMNEHFIGRAQGAGFYVVSLRTTSGFPECSVFTPNATGGLVVSVKKMELEQKS
jgi:hypothetical protein